MMTHQANGEESCRDEVDQARIGRLETGTTTLYELQSHGSESQLPTA
jgi:hypothetical protein